MKPAYEMNDKARLQEALSAAKSLADVVRWFGLAPSGKRNQLVRQFAAEHGLSTAHIGKPIGYGRFTRDQLESFVRDSASVSDVMTLMGLNKRQGNAHIQLSKRLRDLGIDTSHFLGSGWRAGVPQPRRKSAHELLVRLEPPANPVGAKRLRRAMIEYGVPDLCFDCGQGAVWRDKPLLLQIHHRDGDTLNNQPENLCFMCPNCHTQTPNYGNKRRNGARPAGRGAYLEGT